MSGFEVAGVVLGSLPLVVVALEAYSNFLRDWGKAPFELKSLNRQLTTERAKLYNICNQLISDVVPQSDIEPMLQNPFGPLWQSKATKQKIRSRLWDSYEPFEETILEVGEALDSITRRLRVQISQDGQVEWIKKGKMTREFKKFLYRLNRKDYQDALSTISRGISNLDELARLSITLEPSRRKQSRVKVFNILRDLSSSIYRALCGSIRCSDPHNVSLALVTRPIEIGHEREHKKVLQNAPFTIAISFEVVQGSLVKRFWEEVNIKTLQPPIATAPEPDLVKGKGKGKETTTKRVSFAFNQMMSSKFSTQPSPDIKMAMIAVTQSATNFAFTEISDEPAEKTEPLVDLCMALRNGREAPPVCYGHMIDTECSDRYFRVYPSGTAVGSDNWSTISLHDVLESKKGLRPLVSLVEKVQLALAVASSALQLSKTPWLPEVLTRRNVYFFRRDNGISYEHPFLLKTFPEGSLLPLRLSVVTAETHCALTVNPMLFALGILLLEIILGSTLEQLHGPTDNIMEGDDLGIIRDSMAAHRLLEQRVALISPSYKSVVERCIGCTELKELDEDDFRQSVYNGVVSELEAMLEHTKIGI